MYNIIIDTDITVGSLTCYGAILSLNPPVREVQVWLKDETAGQFPWIVEHCLILIKSTSTLIYYYNYSIKLIIINNDYTDMTVDVCNYYSNCFVMCIILL